ncbi:hypothetical protein [Paraflavitalea pollutisoli]|uniref:hypothetical protein n=1 Tax=Paraflavitalea pollutisoli TaxID=3034143 RepID=UPI0023EAEC6E|nr:hypothetical protein [Paraflavitalea sp. H1-2-19X]
MYRRRYIQTRQLIALLLLAVMMIVHVTKSLHTHAPAGHASNCHQEQVIAQAASHHHCSICEFQLSKDTTFTGDITFRIAPVHAAPTFTALLTAINPHRLVTTEGRGPPQA